MGDRALINSAMGARQSLLDGEAIMQAMGGANPGTVTPTPTPNVRRQATDKCYVTERATANSGNATQFQGYSGFTAMRTLVEPSFVIPNFQRTGPGTAIDGPSSKSGRYAAFDGTTAYPLTFGGNRDVTIASGAIVESDPLTGVTIPKGNRIALVMLETYAAAPANFPAVTTDVFNQPSAPVASEAGTALTDKTLTPSAITGYVGSYLLDQPVLVKASVPSNLPSITTLGDSKRAWLEHAALGAGIPFDELGIPSLSMANFMSPVATRDRLINIAATSGNPTLVLALYVNDIISGQSDTAIYNNYIGLKNLLDPLGIKLVLTTPDPVTNSANTGENIAGSFAKRRALDATIRANNGVGYGFIDLAAVTSDPNNFDLWRTDLGKVSTATINAGGSGYVVGDNLFLPDATQIRVTSVGTNGAITGITIQRIGTKVGTAPDTAVAPIAYGGFTASGTRRLAYTQGVGVGATFDLTWTDAGAPTGDGTHPNTQMVWFEGWQMAQRFKTFFGV